MGTCLELSISRSVTCREWEDVYEETLQLVEAFPLAEARQVPVLGYETKCVVRTRERDMYRDWTCDQPSKGWAASGDYDHLGMAERFRLFRDEVDESDYLADAPDPLFDEALSRNGSVAPQNHGSHVLPHYVWGSKTQGEPYHIYLLAIACLIATRLGSKAYVGGDITRTQCERAVRLANGLLAVPIVIPDQCNHKRLYERVAALPLTDLDRLCAYNELYVGNRSRPFGDCVREHFPEEMCDRYWTYRFQRNRIGTDSFNAVLEDYIEQGFDFERIDSIVDFASIQRPEQYESFVRKLLDSVVYVHSDKASESLRGGNDTDGSSTLGPVVVAHLRQQFRHKTVPAFMSLDMIRSVLSRATRDAFPTDAIVDECVEREMRQVRESLSDKTGTEETNESSCPQDDWLTTEVHRLSESRKSYDIAWLGDLKYYKAGDTLSPFVEKVVARSFAFYRSLLEEDKYQELMERTPLQRYLWLERMNQDVYLRDTDWERIHDEVTGRPEAFERYYPMVRVDANGGGKREMLRALVLDDDFYAYAGRLAHNLEMNDEDEEDSVFVFSRTYQLE